MLCYIWEEKNSNLNLQWKKWRRKMLTSAILIVRPRNSHCTYLCYWERTCQNFMLVDKPERQIWAEWQNGKNDKMAKCAPLIKSFVDILVCYFITYHYVNKTFIQGGAFGHFAIFAILPFRSYLPFWFIYEHEILTSSFPIA